VNAIAPLVMALDAPAATVPAAGGKGASLARLARAGLRVPPGFCVTTQAYLDFVARDGLQAAAVAAAAADGPDPDPASAEARSQRIRALFAAAPMPAPAAAAIEAAYAALGHEVAVAVRSSATAEDLPGLSAAGQHDTYLNIRGAAAVLDAVKRCWASLWTARAISYREGQGIPAGQVSLAVVVQRLVPADTAGVLFTADPVTGARDRLVVNASWGLGEAVVSGRVTPDIILLGRSGQVADYQVGAKQVMTVPAADGTREQETPGELRHRQALSPAEADELARAGIAVEDLLGQPVDVEWARAGAELFILQARPITGLPAASPPGDPWNDSRNGDYLWSAGNFSEALPDVMTPATWSFMQIFMTRVSAPPTLPGYPGYGRIGGRFYANLSMSASLVHEVGISRRRFIAIYGPVFGQLPPPSEIPLVPLPRWKIIRLTVAAFTALARRARRNSAWLPEFAANAAGRYDGMRAQIARIEDPGLLAEMWRDRVEPLFTEASDMLAATGIAGGPTLIKVPGQLTAAVGEDDAAVLLSASAADGSALASLGPAVGLAQLARGEIDRAEYTRRYGHRGPHEAEVSIPRPAEDPYWIDDQLALLDGATSNAEDLLARREVARRAAWARLAGRQSPRKVAALRSKVDRWAMAARNRELARTEVARSFWVLRAWLLRAGELTGHGDDMFFLDVAEILSVLRGEPAPLQAVPGRRATYELYCGLPPYPLLIRGRFDPVRWAADPGRRTDRYDAHAASAPPVPREPSAATGEVVTGIAGAPGVAEGVARLISAPEDAGLLGDGEVLVTSVTNIGWTPAFPRAAAVVTDVGAPLSHAAIVARELGIPAVVGCGDATTRLHTGDLLRVNGERGTVEVLRPA
jgi:rifampicin phosphotransferase